MAIESVNIDSFASILGLPEDTLVSIFGPDEAIGSSSQSLAGFPGSSSDPFLVISTGLASDVDGDNTSGSQGTDLGAPGVDGDSLTITFLVPRPANATNIAFDFTFLSEEFPEFVGTEFNDALSVTVDGTEIALDTAGNPINVNNNFFDPTLTASGTIFDGQTPPLRITAPLADTSNPLLNLTIEIADAGDGIFDSAAFINDFEFLEPQTVFVDFDGGTVSFGTAFFIFDRNVSLPSSGLTAAEQDEVIAIANDIYSDFLVEFTDTRPTEGEFSTILVGGSLSGSPSLSSVFPLGGVGVAEDVDFGNNDRSDNALVLSGETFFDPLDGSQSTRNIPLLAQVVAHETGHLLGLRHVIGPNELMFPVGSAGGTNIGGLMPLAEIGPSGVEPRNGTQDSRAELARNVGLRSSSEIIVAESLFDNILTFFALSPGSTASVSGAIIATVNTEGEVLQFQELGDITGDETIEFITPATDEDLIVFFGKSEADGPFDIFLSPSGVTDFDPSTATNANLFATFGIPVADFESELELVMADADGNLTTIGTPETTLLDLGDSEATDGSDILVGTDDNDVLLGFGGDDVITGNGGDDQLLGNSGNDTLDGGSGADELVGGDGDDTFIITDVADSIVETSGSGIDEVISSVSLSLTEQEAEIENLTLSGLTDLSGAGNELDNVITGNEGDNTLIGDIGSDTLEGGTGNDILTGDPLDGSNDLFDQDVFRLGDVSTVSIGNDVITDFDTNNFKGDEPGRTSENNFDTLSFTFSGEAFSLSTGSDILDFVDIIEHDGDVTTDALLDGDDIIFVFQRGVIDNITDSIRLVNVVGDDGLTLSNLEDNSIDQLVAGDVFGGTRADVIAGGSEDDMLTGEDEDDSLIGNKGSDTLVGGGGNDILIGDQLDGRNAQFDQDVFILGDVSTVNIGNDVITDFDTNNFKGDEPGRTSENNFDTLSFTFSGEAFSLSTGSDILDFVDIIEHDGDVTTDALLDGDDIIFVFQRGVTDNITDSIRLVDVVGDDGLTLSRLANNSIDQLVTSDVFGGASVG